MKILYLYKYLFYKILTGVKKIPFAEYNVNEWNAVFILTALSFQNFFAIDILWQVFTGKFLYPIIDKTEGVVLLAIFFIPHYFLFLYKHRYKNIINKFNNESTEKKKKGNGYTIIYIIGSVALFFSLTIIKLIIWGK